MAINECPVIMFKLKWIQKTFLSSQVLYDAFCLKRNPPAPYMGHILTGCHLKGSILQSKKWIQITLATRTHDHLRGCPVAKQHELPPLTSASFEQSRLKGWTAVMADLTAVNQGKPLASPFEYLFPYSRKAIELVSRNDSIQPFDNRKTSIFSLYFID